MFPPSRQAAGWAGSWKGVCGQLGRVTGACVPLCSSPDSLRGPRLVLAAARGAVQGCWALPPVVGSLDLDRCDSPSVSSRARGLAGAGAGARAGAEEGPLAQL